MKSFTSIKKLAVLIFGLFLYALGILLTIHAQLGASPWDTFQIGLSGLTGLTLGQVSQVVGVMIIFLDIVLKEVPGWGTLLNMYFIGYFVDLIGSWSLITDAQTVFSQAAMILVGILAMSWGSFLYLDAGWGAGPRDSLMLGLSKRFRTEVWKARTGIEVCVATAGFFLGVKVGVGTVVLALLVGPAVQLAYRIVGKDPKAKHRTLVDDYNLLVFLRKRNASDIGIIVGPDKGK